MENESTEESTLSLDLPAALDGWLSEQADELGVDRSELVVQLIGSYQVAADAEDGAADELAATIDEEAVDIETTVRTEVDEAVAAATADEGAIAGRVEDRLEPRFDELEAGFEEKIDDVRRRVVQVKQEADGKAPADHEHEEFQRLDELATAVEELRDAVDESESGEVDAELVSQLDDLRSKLTRLARIVVKLREGAENESDDGTLTEIQRTAAREGYEKAVCGACNEIVHVGLLPDAECPHCRSPFGGLVEGSGGLFASKPRLVGPHERPDARGDDGTAEGSGDTDTMSSIVSEGETDGEDENPVSADGGTDE